MKDFYDMKLVQCFMDIKNYFRFKRDVKRELKNPLSKMNKFGIKRNWLGNILYMQVNCTDADFMNADYNYDRMIMTKLKPVVKYLGRELEWNDYLVPQISNFIDDDENPTLSYGVLFIFTGFRMTLTKALVWSLMTLGLIGGGIWAWLHFA